MASEYSVNISLDTKKAEGKLTDLKKSINDLSKQESKSSKTALSSSEKRAKTETQIANLQKRTQSLKNSALRLELKGLDVSRANNKIKLADTNLANRKISLTNKNIALAAKELEILKQQTIEVSKQNRVRGSLGLSAQGDFSRLSDRQSRNREGGRTFMNNPLGRRGIRPTRGFDTQSALISGAFPLLFGQGPVGALAGGLGGGIGGMFGSMGGFAGGIAATAAVQSINQVLASVSQLGQAMSSVNPNIDALAKAVGIAGTAEEKRLKLIEEVNGKQAALNAAMDKMREVIGDEATDRLKEFGETTRLISNDFAIMITKMQADLVPLFNLVDNILGLSKGAKERQRDRALANTDNKEVLDIQNRISELRSASGGGRSGANLRNKEIADLTIALNKLGDKLITENKAKTDKEIKDLEDKSGKAGKGSKQNIDLKIKAIETEIKLRDLNNNLLNNEVVALKKSLIAEEHKVALAEAKGDEDLKNLANVEKTNKLSILNADIAQAEVDLAKEFNDEQEKRNKLQEQEEQRIQRIKDSAEAKILDIEKENELREFSLTATAEEIAFKRIVLSLSKDQLAYMDEQRLKQALADSERITALERQNQIIDEIQLTLASSMSDAIKGLITGTHNLNSALSSVLNKMAEAMLNMGLFGNVGGSLTGGGGLLGTIFGGLLHEGGPARRGNSYIVGEKGPEMFTPGVSGMVTPNNALGGSNNIVVNVDASGTEVQGDDTTSSQLGKVIGLAVQAELVKQSRAGGLLSRA